MIKRIKSTLRCVLGPKGDTDFFAQAGEDAIVWKIASYIFHIQNGFYIDVGAYHPYKHSNTFLLYKAGWRGINIDPAPGTKTLFDKYRSEDTNIEAGVGEQNSELTYYIVGEDSTMNSFSKTNLERLGLLSKVLRTTKIPVFTLEHLLSQHTNSKPIDYLNIDAEGFEIQILRGLNFEIHAPKIISIEQNNVLYLSDVLASDTHSYLASKGYSAIAKNVLLKDVSTVFYIREKSLDYYDRRVGIAI